MSEQSTEFPSNPAPIDYSKVPPPQLFAGGR